MKASTPFKSVLKSSTSYRVLLGLILLSLVSYQNCAPAGKDNAFVLGANSSSNTEASTTASSPPIPQASPSGSPTVGSSATPPPTPKPTPTPPPTPKPTATPSPTPAVLAWVLYSTSSSNPAPQNGLVDPTCDTNGTPDAYTIGDPPVASKCTVSGAYCTEVELFSNGIIPPGTLNILICK